MNVQIETDHLSVKLLTGKDVEAPQTETDKHIPIYLLVKGAVADTLADRIAQAVFPFVQANDAPHPLDPDEAAILDFFRIYRQGVPYDAREGEIEVENTLKCIEQVLREYL